jgi:hypothetical protein
VNPLFSLHLRRQLRLVLSSPGVPELGPEPREAELFSRFWRQETEEGVVLDADLPESLGRSVVAQLEPDGGFELVSMLQNFFLLLP